VLESLLGDLRPKHVRLVQLRYSRGLTFVEIAGEFGVVESAVHAMHGRILRALREALLDRGIGSLSDIL
jgi:DNA-directed RNA polymerase specialized sigma24 family protein